MPMSDAFLWFYSPFNASFYCKWNSAMNNKQQEKEVYENNFENQTNITKLL